MLKKSQKMLRAAMEGKDVGVKINHVERDPTHIPHQKEVIVSDGRAKSCRTF